MRSKNTIVTIDPGASGGIAVFSNGRIQAVAMPSDVNEMNSYFQYLNSTYEDIFVFIEKVQAYGKDDDEPGKKFAINKMLANYQQVLTVVKLCGFRFVEVYPVSWQTSLGLKMPKSEGEETKTQRKNRYKEYAQNCFPELKVNLKTSDALCLVQFALVKIQNDIGWIRERIQNETQSKLL
jgi:hypothetical protein